MLVYFGCLIIINVLTFIELIFAWLDQKVPGPVAYIQVFGCWKVNFFWEVGVTTNEGAVPFSW